MRYLNSVGLGLSLVFGCLLLALVAELYYLLWWKKRFINREIENDYSSPSREFLYMFCWKKPSSLTSTALNPQELCSSTNVHEQQSHLQTHSKEFLLKPYGEDGMENGFMGFHDLSVPPRFLFTIKEETKEDLESEDAKSRCDNRSRKGSRSRSLSELLTTETPYLTPLASPSFFTPPLTPVESAYSHHGFNPLFESSSDAEFNKLRSSPPPKFKFLQVAEEKFCRKLMEEGEKRSHSNEGHDQLDGPKPSSAEKFHKNEEDGSFIAIIVAKNNK